MNWYFRGWERYADFSGRANRQEYWTFTLINVAVIYALRFVVASPSVNPLVTLGVSVVMFVFSLAMIIPALAVAVRRLHDTDRSGWWFFFLLVPIVGAITLIVFYLLESQPGSNRFGGPS